VLALEPHPHAAAVLGAALGPDRGPAHAYLLHGPAGTGKREAARAFAAEQLRGEVARRVALAAAGRAVQQVRVRRAAALGERGAEHGGGMRVGLEDGQHSRKAR